MNERRLLPVYLLGAAGSAYVFWYYVSTSAFLPALVFGLVTAAFVARLRILTADS
ncbi:hypothetical protein C478_12070 [Natrinema thermotolerans DSM 11552]|nr:hypothetical protein C478_12070 [Natrinema thermotolerans DSM 11552]